jgi:hypothetical protein
MDTCYRANHRAALEQTSLKISLDDIQDLDVENWEEMTPASLDFWIASLCKKSRTRKVNVFQEDPFKTFSVLKMHLECENRIDFK